MNWSPRPTVPVQGTRLIQRRRLDRDHGAGQRVDRIDLLDRVMGARFGAGHRRGRRRGAKRGGFGRRGRAAGEQEWEREQEDAMQDTLPNHMSGRVFASCRATRPALRRTVSFQAAAIAARLR